MAVPDCLQGSACFLVGVILILVKWALVGICVETYGFWLLFSGFFPVVLGFLRRLPVLGRLLDLPVLKTVGSLNIMACWQCAAFVCPSCTGPLFPSTSICCKQQPIVVCLVCLHGQPSSQYNESPATARCKQLFAFRDQDSSAPRLTDVQVLNRIAPPQASGLPV